MPFHLRQSWVEKIFSAGKGEEKLPSLVLGPRRECRVVVRWERVRIVQPEVSRETRVVQRAAMLTHVGAELGIHWIVGHLDGSSLDLSAFFHLKDFCGGPCVDARPGLKYIPRLQVPVYRHLPEKKKVWTKKVFFCQNNAWTEIGRCHPTEAQPS